jgi:hypothetical protein
MRSTAARGCAIVLAAVAGLLACGERETPEQRLAWLRSRHEIYPVGTTTIRDAAGLPSLLIDLQIANQGVHPLGRLTVLVRVQSASGQERLAQRVTLDLTGLRPGVGERRSARVDGFELAEDDQVFVELEANLPLEQIRALPEYSEVAGSS